MVRAVSSAPINPVEVEEHIRGLVNRIAKGVGVVDKRYREFLKADLEYDRVYLEAYVQLEGSIKDREACAKLAAMKEREARDVAEAAYKYAERTAKSLDSELRAMQSIGASVRSMYGVAGRGEF